MAYTLSNGLVSFVFDTDATSGLKLSSFTRTGGATWTNAETYLWRAKVYDTTTAPTTTTANLLPTAATCSASQTTDESGDELLVTWTAVPVGSGDALDVIMRFRVNTDEDWLNYTIESNWNGTTTKYALHDLRPCQLLIDPLNEGRDFAVLPFGFGIQSEDPITNLLYTASPPTGFPDTGFNLQTDNRWTYPAGRGWSMAMWGYYDGQSLEGWMLWCEDWSKEYAYVTFQSNGTRMQWLWEQWQPDNVLIGNNGRTLGSGYKFCIRPFLAVNSNAWAEMGMFYRDRVEADPPDFYVPALPDRTDLSDAEKAYGIFIDAHLLDTSHAPSDGKPANFTTYLNTIRSNSGAPASTPLHGMVEANNYNLQYVGETADGDLQSTLTNLYDNHNAFLENWWPESTDSAGPGSWDIHRWDQSVGDSAELRWWTSNEESGALRMDRTGYLAGGGTDRLQAQSSGYYRERTYPVVSFAVLTVTVTGTPNADGFTGTLYAVIIPASGSARLGRAPVASLGASTVVVTTAFLDSLGNTVTPAGGDTIAVYRDTTQMDAYCPHARVNAGTYLTRLINNTTLGIQQAHDACGYYLDTYSEPLLQSALASRTACYRDHSTWGQINVGYVRHPYGGGDWYKDALRELIYQWKQRARAAQSSAGRDPFFRISAEDIDETMHDRIDWCWHIVSSGNLWRSATRSGSPANPTVHKYKTIPLYAVVYSGRTMGRGLDNELSSIILNDVTFYGDDDLVRFMGYCLGVEWPYGITWPTISLYDDDTYPLKDFFDNTLYVAGGGSVPNKVKQIRDLWVQIVTAESNWLIAAGFRYGQMMPPAIVNIAATTTTTGMAQSTWTAPAPAYHSYDTIYDRASYPRVTHGVWKADDGTIVVVFCNWSDTAGSWSGVLPLTTCGLGDPGSAEARRIQVRRLDYTGAESGSAQFDSVTGTLTLTSVAAYTTAFVELTVGGQSMAAIVKGATFSSTVTAGGLHAMVESATITGIERGAVDPDTISVATLSTSELASPQDNEVWQTSPANQLATRDAASAKWVGALPQVRRYTVAAGSTDVVAGQVLMAIGISGLDTLTLQAASGASTAKVVGVALHAASVSQEALCVIAGPARVKCTGTVNAGEGVKLSSTVGVVQSAGAAGSARGWEIIGTATTSDSGGFVWISLRR